MKGFDKEFRDYEHYILRITDQIWLEKDIGSIKRYYTEDCPVYTLGGIVIGSEAVINGTIKTLAAFPDRLLNAEDVIWSGDDESGYFSSHRIISPSMTNLGHSEFGPPTGEQATVRTIADCAARDNQIYEEWLMRDNMGLVRQLGLDVHELARRLAVENKDNRDLHDWIAQEIDRVKSSPCLQSGDTGIDPHKDLDAYVQSLLVHLWSDRELDAIDSRYTSSAKFHGPDARDLSGIQEIKGYLSQIQQCLSDTAISVDNICSIQHDEKIMDVAVRWCLVGKHSADGLYGEPSGKDILIMAASHWRIEDGIIHEDWTVFDELAVLRQVYS